jgi:hypothetical protein
MPLNEIEQLLFSGAGNSAQLLTRFHFADGRVELRFEPVSDDQNKRRRLVAATFKNAIMETVDEDEVERDSWPLDIIGFDCSPCGERWKFVLNCGSVEWCWNSEWPIVTIGNA